ncbi:unnamed protein product [Ranitomeya imitator]|uniref:Uncharacterized protein n=1 Tax=Ranitomeya imitator TaxID=111125 RepID=A0ABN9LNM7_9NEOB|nr:unnamed protein product [Ranitomeya imitator]
MRASPTPSHDRGSEMRPNDSEDEFYDTASDVTVSIKSKPIQKVTAETGKPPPAEEANLEELTDLQLKFEIKEVTLELTKQQEKEENTILLFSIQQLGTVACVKTFDLSAVSYLKKIALDYYDVSGYFHIIVGTGPSRCVGPTYRRILCKRRTTGATDAFFQRIRCPIVSCGEVGAEFRLRMRGLIKQPLHLISSSDKPGLDLLKVEYIKADRNGPNFHTVFEKTEQTLKLLSVPSRRLSALTDQAEGGAHTICVIAPSDLHSQCKRTRRLSGAQRVERGQVAFSSMDLLLHSQALLSAISFITAAIPSIADKAEVSSVQKQQDKGTFVQKGKTQDKYWLSA